MNLGSRHREYLNLIGIDVWVSKDSDTAVTPQFESEQQSRRKDSLDDLRKQVSVCTKCRLHAGRTQTVFGTGSYEADWMLIGEAPGAEEDKQGEPFVGRAGKLLTAMLASIGLEREEVFIANILKCRPPNNRDPSADEVAACEEYLNYQIKSIKPRLIIALGRIAAQNLLKSDVPIGKMRGKDYEYGEEGIPVVVTYHPAYLLRSPREKRKSWQDLQLAVRKFNTIRS
ncbi:MAG: uracil-DNA glycosylase [Gammaproteobacteria bacterium]|nr:uracil-DNA glycosylase [Gammaproteobacteria bacterium]